jgi:predicted dehydrogenase
VRPIGEIVAVCDADLAQAEGAKERLGISSDVYQDYRQLLERNDLDAVLNATPDHWHTKINIDACRAGLDVYAEKPITLTIEEGRQLCKVVEQTGRIVQVGTQQRCFKHFQTAVELVRNGRIGKLREVYVLLPFWPTRGGPFTEQPIPATLDWDLYQGQAPERPYHPARTRFNFRWFYEYAGGICTDWGNHHMDIAQWGMGQELGGPTHIDAKGHFPNDGKPLCYSTPDRFVAKLKYPDDVTVFFYVVRDDKYLADMNNGGISADEDAALFADMPEPMRTEQRNGIMFVGETGRLHVNRAGLYGAAAEQLKDNPLPDDAWRTYKAVHPMGNFVDCMRSREQPASPVQIEHHTITTCHLTNISMRLGRPIRWDVEREQIIGDDKADAMQRREQRPPYAIDA